MRLAETTDGRGTGHRAPRARSRPAPRSRPSHSLLLALVLASVSLITLDRGGDGSPLEPARLAVGEVIAPAQAATATVARPFTAVPAWLRDRGELQRELAVLRSENARLRFDVRTADLDRHRLAEFDELTRAAGTSGFAMVPARVVGFGPAQSFSRTVTIDAGSRAGIRPDMTVLNADGLVGRVLRTTRSTATVLLVVDAESTVGGRIGRSLEIGFLRGRGEVGDDGRLDLQLVDAQVVPDQGDVVVTWGSQGGAPYVGGVPVGRVTRVWRSIRESSQRAVIEPFVDFSALDLVGVVVPSGARSDRAVLEADGSLR